MVFPLSVRRSHRLREQAAKSPLALDAVAGCVSCGPLYALYYFAQRYTTANPLAAW
jgi:hypothetical protein